MSSYVSVDLYIKDRSDNALPGTVVKVLSQDGQRAYSQHTADAGGHVGLLMPAPGTYQLRLFSFGISFSPVLIDTRENETNSFNLYGDKYSPKLPTDARLCLACGYFRDLTGAPKAFLDLHFVADFSPFVLEGSAVVSERVTTRTNEQGWAEVPLIRNAIYGVTIENWENQFRRITVPDCAQVNLAHLLFPRVERVDCALSLPITVRKGQDIEVPLSVVTTDKRVLTDVSSDLIWSSSLESIFFISGRSQTSLTLRAVNKGSAQLLATRLSTVQGGDPPIYYPDTQIQGVPVSVSVI